jgi:DNA-binding MarR family transcriptional regulator
MNMLAGYVPAVLPPGGGCRLARGRAMVCTPTAASRTMRPESRPPTKQQYEALANFRYQLRRYLRYSEEISQREGLTPLQYQLLLQIKGFPGREHASVSELAERMQAKHHGVVALVTRCEKAGMVQRRTTTVDRRLVEVHLTAKGERLLRRLAELHRTELLQLQGQFFVPGQRDFTA